MEVLHAGARSTDPRLAKMFRKVVESDPSQDVRTRAAEILRAKGDTGGGDGATRVATHIEEGAQRNCSPPRRPLLIAHSRARRH